MTDSYCVFETHYRCNVVYIFQLRYLLRYLLMFTNNCIYIFVLYIIYKDL